MDLIYTDTSWIEQGILKDFSIDCAYGSDENNLEITTRTDILELGCLVYVEGTDIGGIIDSKKTSSNDGEVVYSGRTWSGILASKIVEPPANADYRYGYTVYINQYLRNAGFGNLFEGTFTYYGKQFKFERYCNWYVGITKMLKNDGLKLLAKWRQGKVLLSADSIKTYTEDSIFTSDLMTIEVTQNENYVNHLICLGRGELKEREVVHLYADEDGNVSSTQTFTGLDEIVDVYDYPAVESTQELIDGGTQRLKELAVKGYAEGDLNETDVLYDLGDIVKATDEKTGITVQAEILKKIVTMSDTQMTINYKIK